MPEPDGLVHCFNGMTGLHHREPAWQEQDYPTRVPGWNLSLTGIMSTWL